MHSQKWVLGKLIVYYQEKLAEIFVYELLKFKPLNVDDLDKVEKWES